MTRPERILHLDELPTLAAGCSSEVVVLAGPGCVLPGYAGPGLCGAQGRRPIYRSVRRRRSPTGRWLLETHQLFDRLINDPTRMEALLA